MQCVELQLHAPRSHEYCAARTPSTVFSGRISTSAVAYVTYTCPIVACWAFSGGLQARPNAKTDRRRNGSHRAVRSVPDAQRPRWPTLMRHLTSTFRHECSQNGPHPPPQAPTPFRPWSRPALWPGTGTLAAHRKMQVMSLDQARLMTSGAYVSMATF